MRHGEVEQLLQVGQVTRSGVVVARHRCRGPLCGGRRSRRCGPRGSQVNEFNLLAGDGKRILGEVENIGPGLTRNLVVSATAGEYVAACKPGLTGKGIRTKFTVTGREAGTGRARPDQQAVDQAVRRYTGYVHAESARLLLGTATFVRAYAVGDDARAPGALPAGTDALGAHRDRR